MASTCANCHRVFSFQQGVKSACPFCFYVGYETCQRVFTCAVQSPAGPMYSTQVCGGVVQLFANQQTFVCVKCSQNYQAMLNEIPTGFPMDDQSTGPPKTEDPPKWKDGVRSKRQRSTTNKTATKKPRKQRKSKAADSEEETETEEERHSDLGEEMEESSDDEETWEALVQADICVKCYDGGFILQCDSCEHGYHLECLFPALRERDIPDGDWICPVCVPLNRQRDTQNKGQADRIFLARDKACKTQNRWWPVVVRVVLVML